MGKVRHAISWQMLPRDGERAEMQTARRKIVFLDIDGVLQPFSSTRRFQVSVRDEAAAYASSVGNPFYENLDPHDVCAVLLDWDSEAVANLKNILDETGAEIVVSSDWRDFNEDAALRALLAIWNLDRYFGGSTAPFVPKAESIMGYISDHGGEIAAYVVLDDDPRVGALPNAIPIRGKLSEEDADEAVRVLGGRRPNEQ